MWKLDWSNQPQVNAAEPVVLDDKTLLIGSGYDKGGAEIRVSRDGDQWKAELVRKAKSFRLKFNAPVVKNGYAYGLDESIMTCLDLKEFKTKWKKGRYGFGQLLLIGDEILVLTEQGEIAIVQASPERVAGPANEGRAEATKAATERRAMRIIGNLNGCLGRLTAPATRD